MTPSEMAGLHGLAFTMPRPWSEAEFAELIGSPLVFALHEAAGFVLGRVVAGEAELLTLAVDPQLWGRGTGGRLVAGFVAEARQRGAESAFLEVAATNHRAQHIYGRNGFVLAGRRKAYYLDADGQTEDALILVRMLGDQDNTNY